MLHQRYGAAAANSVSQLQAQSHMALGLPGHQQQRPQGSHVPNGQGQITHQHHQPPMNKTQTDGAGDDPLSEWKAEVMRRRQAAERQNSEGDQLIREQIRLQMLRLEGGGLLRPLDEHQSPRLANRRVGPSYPNQTAITATSLDQLPACEPTVGRSRAQFDGADDDVKAEDDEDAINSDLDDPDDPINEEHEGDDAVGQVMLCTYDKVQRVKNKWKCTLKDGILTTGGREYATEFPTKQSAKGKLLILVDTSFTKPKASSSGRSKLRRSASPAASPYFLCAPGPLLRICNIFALRCNISYRKR